MVPRGTPKKAFFDPKFEKRHFPDFPILTSVGGPWDNEVRGSKGLFSLAILGQRQRVLHVVGREDEGS